MTPLHRLGPREIVDDARQDVGEQLCGRGTLLFDHGDVGVALFGIGGDLGLIDRRQAGGFEKAVDGGLGRADAGALLFFPEVGRARRDADDGEREAARGDEGPGALVEQAGFDQVYNAGGFRDMPA